MKCILTYLKAFKLLSFRENLNTLVAIAIARGGNFHKVHILGVLSLTDWQQADPDPDATPGFYLAL